jgi:hypothetical protein
MTIRQTISENWKRYLTSSGVTFLAAFILYLSANLDQLTAESLETGAYVAVVFAAIRAGVKALMELVATYIRK